MERDDERTAYLEHVRETNDKRQILEEVLQRHGVESVEREVRWLSDLIAEERRAGQKSPLDNQPTENA